ncbi:peptidoglycan recognition protein 3-like [Temnothorax nylanderi]|uniref:peptidoglycan recognition protein 3-like n=1 Tax=Temnothorax nylanderi TaxID=102681 RepID=UPI003A859EDD
MRSSSYLIRLSTLCAFVLLLEYAVLAIPIDNTNFINATECPRIVSRKEWKARERRCFEIMPVRPVPYVVVHHGGTDTYCYDQESCSAIVRAYQNFHIDDHNWCDIGYSFLIGEDGNIYEGRGWDYVGAHAPGYNTQSIGMCVIGNFTGRLPNAAALKALDELIACGVSLGKIKVNYNVIGHRQAKATECPGTSFFYKYVKNLPGWTEHPKPRNSTDTKPIVQKDDTVAMWTEIVSQEQYISSIKCLYITCQVTCGISIVLQVKMYIATTTTLIFATVYVTFITQEAAANNPNIISRAQWGARAPKRTALNLKSNPAPYVIIHHSTGSGCETQAICQLKVRQFQNDHMNRRNWADIGYNFLIGEDGNVYEGRGWDKQGAHSVPYNKKSIGICIIGDYRHRTPNAAAVQAVANLIAHGVQNHKIKNDYKLLGHLQTWTTACPGNSLYTMIKSWPNWSPNP